MDPQLLGILMVIAGIVLIVAETIVPGFLIAVPGTLAVIYGILLILFPGAAATWWGPWVLAALSAPLAFAVIAMYRRLAPPSKPVTASYEGLIGAQGVVVREVRPDNIRGLVRIGSDLWSATTRGDKPIPRGTRVVVVGVEGVHLVVEPLEHGGGEEL